MELLQRITVARVTEIDFGQLTSPTQFGRNIGSLSRTDSK